MDKKAFNQIIAREGLIAIPFAWAGIVLIVPSLIGIILMGGKSPQMVFLLGVGCFLLFPMYVFILLFRVTFWFIDWAHSTIQV